MQSHQKLSVTSAIPTVETSVLMRAKWLPAAVHSPSAATKLHPITPAFMAARLEMCMY